MFHQYTQVTPPSSPKKGAVITENPKREITPEYKKGAKAAYVDKQKKKHQTETRAIARKLKFQGE